MSADAVTDPLTLASGESKSARKKKAKAEAAAKQSEGPTSSSTPEPGAESSAQEAKSNGIDSAYESPYIKELYKNIRSVNKKLSLMQKVDSIVAANPSSSLDDLVASRKINNDQKTQALKKPALQASLTQLEDQISQYKKFDQEYQQRLNTEKELLQSSHKDELDKLREAVEAEAKIEAQKESKERLLMLSRFLRAAAARRQNEEDQSEEGKAFEGALLLVYGGDPSAVLAAEKIIEGADEPVPSVEGDLLTVKYSQIKELSLKYAPYATEEAWVADVAHAEPAAPQPEDNTAIDIGTDPTIANAGLTEQGDVQINGTAESAEISTAPEQSSIDLGAANAAAEDQWDQSAPGVEGSMTEPLKIIPRDPAEADNPHEPAAVNSTQSWADDAATEAQKTEIGSESTAAPQATTTGDSRPTAATNEAVERGTTAAPTVRQGDDGFHAVEHRRGGRGRGGFEQRGGRGRGGFRGGEDGPGRGRGGFRGDRGRGDGESRGDRGRGGFRGDRGRGDHESRGGRGAKEGQGQGQGQQ
ncbi:hypothetical protein LTR60_002324 [Cryomyces antarcticus]|nr:hypothetical protein LTR39_002699 [Cryomyces antarcticus]KAK5016603.1 hypothetical protein LTR60_002324 [Cryomyces antarcticus]